MNHIQGEVSMRIVIDRNGQVIECKDLSGPVALTSAASSAVKQWRYRPFTVNGQTFEIETAVTLTFKLGE